MASNNDGIIRRRVTNTENKASKPVEVVEMPHRTLNSSEIETEYRESKLESGTYWLTRIVFLRSLAFVYCNAPIIVLPEGGNPGRTSGNPGECQIYMEQSLTFSRDLGKGGKLNSPGPWGMPIDNFLWIICYHS